MTFLLMLPHILNWTSNFNKCMWEFFMINYDRKITYIDKYSSDIKIGSGGYIKTQIRDGLGTIRIELSDDEIKYVSNPFQIGFFVWNENDENKITACAFGQKNVNEDMPWVYEFNPEDMAGNSYDKISGIILCCDKKIYLADWSRQSGTNQIYDINWKNSLREELTKEEPESKYKDVEAGLDTQIVNIPEEQITTQSIPDFLITKKREKKSNVHYDKSYYMKINDWKDLFKKYDIVEKFNDDQMYDVIEIGYDDLKYLPNGCEGMVNNSFLLHGLFNYGHVILAKYKCKKKHKVYVLGIPGVTNSSERTMAPMFGFEHFKLARRNQGEDINFGYWYRLFTD